MDDAVKLAVAVAKLETWLNTTGGRCEIVSEPCGTFERCPVVRLTHPSGASSAGRDPKDATLHVAIVDALRWV